MNIVNAIKNNETEKAIRLLETLQEQNLDANIIEPNLYNDSNLYNILQLACLNDLTEVSLKILDLKFDINYQDKMYKDTALHLAIFNCQEVVSKILDLDCDVNLQNSLGMTPLHYACNYKMVNIIKLLLDTNKCNLHILDNNNNTAFDLLRKNIDYYKNTNDIVEQYYMQNLQNILNDFYDKQAKELNNIIFKYFVLEENLAYNILHFIY